MLDCFKSTQLKSSGVNFWAVMSPSEEHLENNHQKQFNANSRAGELSWQNVRRNMHQLSKQYLVMLVRFQTLALHYTHVGSKAWA